MKKTVALIGFVFFLSVSAFAAVVGLEVTINSPLEGAIYAPSETHCTVEGTLNTNTVVSMTWSNGLTSAHGSFSGQESWSVSVPLGTGINTITITASAGVESSEQSVSVVRTQIHSGDSPIHYVSLSGGNVWPYTNWTDAATGIQSAVYAAASNDTVLVMDGVYDAGATATPGSSLLCRVVIEKDIAVGSVNGRDVTFIVGAADPVSTNGPAAIRCAYLSTGSLTGFTLTNGHTHAEGDYDYNQTGGGVFLDGAGLVSNCTVTGCSAEGEGGGVECYFGGLLADCIVTENHGGECGGGVYCMDGGMLDSCLVSSNRALYSGGGIFIYAAGLATNCTLVGNSAELYEGGGADLYGGGSLTGCLVADNDAGSYGGGVLCKQGSLTNCLLVRNVSQDDGGGIDCFDGFITGCTLAENRAGDAGGGISLHSGSEAKNCVVFDNTGSYHDNIRNSESSVSYTCSPGLSGTGNIDADPLFVDPASGNYRLMPTSPCRDAGTNVYAAGSVDLDGNPRIVNGTVDMGAYELEPFFEMVIGTGLPAVQYGVAKWGDYDSDGDLDLLMAGEGTAGDVGAVYCNNGDGTFSDISAGLPAVHEAAGTWGDYDSDGDLDVFLCGYGSSGRMACIYRNNGDQTFTQTAVLEGVNNGDAAWGDYDNDGDLDIVYQGWSSTYQRQTRLYRNNGDATFTLVSGTGLVNVERGSLDWADYDADGDLDLLLTGGSSSGDMACVYRNNGDDTFTDIAAGLQGVSYRAAAAWGDYDSDGDPDILLTGYSGGSRYACLYRNDGSDTFTEVDAGFNATADASVSWGDFDNDGDLDVLCAGYNYNTWIYRNDGGDTFSSYSNSFTAVRDASVAWGDYNDDGRLDALVAGLADSSEPVIELWENLTAAQVANAVPSAPSGLCSSNSPSGYLLSWDAAADGETASSNLTYNLRIGTNPGDDDVMPAMADLSAGYRRIPARGNVDQNTGWLICDLTDGQAYYWSVQAVDTALAGGAWAVEGSFIMRVDSDGDGIPDYWETLYGLNPTNAADAAANPDNDPFNTGEEYIADTDPTNSNDWFRVSSISNSTVFFDSSSNRLYTLLSRTNLVSGQWSEVGSQMGVGGADSMSGTNDVPQEFFKLEVEIP